MALLDKKQNRSEACHLTQFVEPALAWFCHLAFILFPLAEITYYLSLAGTSLWLKRRNLSGPINIEINKHATGSVPVMHRGANWMAL